MPILEGALQRWELKIFLNQISSPILITLNGTNMEKMVLVQPISRWLKEKGFCVRSYLYTRKLQIDADWID